MVSKDFDENVGMVITMGTSLQVAPFYALPNLVRCPRVLVDLDPSRTFWNVFMARNCGSSVKFGKRRVTLRPTWNDRTISKYFYTSNGL